MFRFEQANVGQPAEVRGMPQYLPFLAVRHEVVQAITKKNADPAALAPTEQALHVSNGVMPNLDLAGVVHTGAGFAAYDHVALQVEGDTWVIHPSARSDVDRQTGQIQAPGAVTLTDEEGRIQLVAIVSPLNPWSREARRRSAITAPSIGGLAIERFSCLDIPPYEVTDIAGGVITAKLPRRFIALPSIPTA